MLFYVASRLISATAAFLYPGYASYKTLSQRPANEVDLERWLMYWSVLACVVTVEYVAEWLVSWLPLYYPIKTIFLLYLALPQAAGAQALYTHHLRPFLAAHENNIDAALLKLRAAAYEAIQRALRTAWESLTAALNQSGTGAPAGPVAREAAADGAPPALNDPVSGPAQMAQGLWSTYGPSLLAGGAALVRQAQVAAAQAAARPAPASASASADERRRQLEAELAALGRTDGLAPREDVQGYDVAVPSPSSSTSTPSSPGLRERTGSGSGGKVGAFEEVEVPSDVDEAGVGYPTERPAAQTRTSWFGWGAGGAKGAYEKVKSD